MLAVRSGNMDRASVALPSVKCSSCSDSIPLSSLGDHICRPPSRSIANRSAPRPSQIAIPTPTASNSSRRPSGPSSSFDAAPPRPAFAGPSSARSSPSANSLTIPDISSGRSSPIDKLSPHSLSSGPFAGHSSSPRTPSPTNPFFPQLPTDGKKGPMNYGLGLTVSHRPEGPFPTDAPLPMGVSDLSGLNTAESGMAGVGRRAFQAAAWGVTAGISMAHAAAKTRTAEPARPTAPRSAGPTPSSLPPWQQHMPRPPAPSSATMGRSRSGTDAQSPAVPFGELSAPVPQRSASAMDRAAEPVVAPPRSSSAMSKNPPSAHRTKPSVSSTTSSRSSYDNNREEGIAELLRARAPERKASNDKANFFNKYKEMQRSGSQASSSGTTRLIPGARREGDAGNDSDERELVASPQQSNLDLDDEASALPWATPALGASPVIKQTEQREKKHYRQLTVGSESSSGSSRSDRQAGSSRETEEIVTPSQSLEGFHQTIRRDRADPRPLKQIHESDEDENERVVFGALSRPNMPRSESASTINTKDTHVHSTSHTRSRTAPVRRIKTCQKCGEQVGGTRKFVERDGVVLCEADWKKMYLPSCRRCDKLIETRMVSADDGQLKGKWHAACFTCTRCDEPFEGKDFYVHAGRPWCQYHYAQETGTLCASATCRRPIEGACILTQGSNPQRFHPGHLRCDQRGCADAMDEYYDVAGKRYCERHVGGATASGRGGLGSELRAEKRRTRLVDLPRGGLGF